MAATYDGDGNRVMQVSRCHSREKGTKSGEASEGDDDEGGDEAWAQASALDLFWYGVVAGSAAALSAASPATIGAAVELACHDLGKLCDRGVNIGHDVVALGGIVKRLRNHAKLCRRRDKFFPRRPNTCQGI